MPQPQIYIHLIWKVTIIPQLVNLFPKMIYRIQNMVIFALCDRCPYLTLPFVLMLRFKSFKGFKTRDFRFKPSFPINSDFPPMSEAFLPIQILHQCLKLFYQHHQYLIVLKLRAAMDFIKHKYREEHMAVENSEECKKL